MNLFKIVWHRHHNTHFWDCETYEKHEYLCERESVFPLYIILKSEYEHVKVYNLSGQEQDTKKGVRGLSS